MEFRRILVRASNWVGDAVMCVPALQALRERFPQAYIAILARPWVADLYAREPFCDELIPYNLPRGTKGLYKKWLFARRLSKYAFDCAILLPNAFEAAALARIAGIPARIGYSREGRGWLLTHPIPIPNRGETPPHQRFYYLELLKRATLIREYSDNDPIRLSGWANIPVQEGKIGVSPGAAYGGAKRWIPERFAAAAVSIARERQGSVAVFGSKDEFPICEIVRRNVELAGVQCKNFAGATTLAEFIMLAASCEVFVTNDSGPMHIASALGVPTVAVFGATDEFATGPTGEHSRVVRVPVECSPCLRRECPIDHRCMTAVSADAVADVALSLIAIERKA